MSRQYEFSLKNELGAQRETVAANVGKVHVAMGVKPCNLHDGLTYIKKVRE